MSVHDGFGRVLVHNATTGDSEVVADGLVFANGISLAEDGDSLVVSDLGRMRLMKINLKDKTWYDKCSY